MGSATLLVLPGLVLVIVGELAARVSPAWVLGWPPAGYVYGLAYPLLAVGTVWRLTSFRWLKSLGPLAVLLLTWPSFSHVFSVGLSKPDVAMSEDSFEVTTFNVRRLDEFEWLDGDQTRQDIATWLAEQPDGIWCFQEFPKKGKPRCVRPDFRGSSHGAGCSMASRGWACARQFVPREGLDHVHV